MLFVSRFVSSFHKSLSKEQNRVGEKLKIFVSTYKHLCRPVLLLERLEFRDRCIASHLLHLIQRERICTRAVVSSSSWKIAEQFQHNQANEISNELNLRVVERSCKGSTRIFNFFFSLSPLRRRLTHRVELLYFLSMTRLLLEIVVRRRLSFNSTWHITTAKYSWMFRHTFPPFLSLDRRFLPSHRSENRKLQLVSSSVQFLIVTKDQPQSHRPQKYYDALRYIIGWLGEDGIYSYTHF